MIKHPWVLTRDTIIQYAVVLDYGINLHQLQYVPVVSRASAVKELLENVYARSQNGITAVRRTPYAPQLESNKLEVPSSQVL